jgi:hypothetical protein
MPFTGEPAEGGARSRDLSARTTVTEANNPVSSKAKTARGFMG